ARQLHGSLAADRSRATRFALRSSPAAELSAAQVPSRKRSGQSRHRAQVGCAYVLDAAHRSRLRTAGSHARQPAGHPGEHCFTDLLIGRLAPPNSSGRLNNESWSEVRDRIDGWWDHKHRPDLQSEPWSKREPISV